MIKPETDFKMRGFSYGNRNARSPQNRGSGSLRTGSRRGSEGTVNCVAQMRLAGEFPFHRRRRLRDLRESGPGRVPHFSARVPHLTNSPGTGDGPGSRSGNCLSNPDAPICDGHIGCIWRAQKDNMAAKTNREENHGLRRKDRNSILQALFPEDLWPTATRTSRAPEAIWRNGAFNDVRLSTFQTRLHRECACDPPRRVRFAHISTEMCAKRDRTTFGHILSKMCAKSARFCLHLCAN
jgi:hypothetical protein